MSLLVDNCDGVPDSPDSENLPSRRESQELAVPDTSAELSLCPSCGRWTRTVGRGTCADCWQAKSPDGEPALRPVTPKTLPLLGSIDDVPNWVWFALATALVGVILRGLTLAL